MTSQPESISVAYAGSSVGEQRALLAAARTVARVPRVDDPTPVTLLDASADLVFFQGNTRMSPFTGTGDTVTRVATSYAGSGGPCGLPKGNSLDSLMPYQGFTTEYDTGGAHAGGLRIKVYLRTNQKINLESGVGYRAIVFPQAANVAGRCFPAPEDITGCFVYDLFEPEEEYTGVSNASGYIDLTLVSSPTKPGWDGLTLTSGGGDVVFIVSYREVTVNDVPTDDYQYNEQSGEKHELVYTHTRGAAGHAGIWHPYTSVQRMGNLTNATQLTSLGAPYPSCADKTEQNWYLKPTVMVPPGTLTNGQSLKIHLTGNVGWGAAAYLMEMLMFFSNAEENGWDPWLHKSSLWPAANNSQTAHWYEPGPYGTFTGATWDNGTLTLSATGIGLIAGDALWLTAGTNATKSVYVITDKPTADSVVLGRTIGASATSGIAGFIGGIARDVGGETWIGGRLNYATHTGPADNGPVTVLQSEIASVGNVNFEVDVTITHFAQASGTGNNTTHAYQISAEFRIGGVGNATTGVVGATAGTVAVTRRSCVLNLANVICNPVTEPLGITLLFKGAEATTGTGEYLFPGARGWYSRAPFDPRTGMGYPLRFTSSSAAPAVCTANPCDGTRLTRVRTIDVKYMGSQSR
jgi:hypothetical protein